MSELFSIIFLFFVVFFFARMFLVATFSVRKWANENNLMVLEKQFRLFRTGPFFIAYNQPVYRLVVQTANGEKKECWIRCGSYGGWNPKYFEVIWSKSNE